MSKAPEGDGTFSVKHMLFYSKPVVRCTHDYTNQFNMKWKKNHFKFGGRNVVGQATMLAHLAQ